MAPMQDFQPTPQPHLAVPIGEHIVASGAPGHILTVEEEDRARRVCLLESALHYLLSARRYGDSYLRSQNEACIRQDLRALGARP